MPFTPRFINQHTIHTSIIPNWLYFSKFKVCLLLTELYAYNSSKLFLKVTVQYILTIQIVITNIYVLTRACSYPKCPLSYIVHTWFGLLWWNQILWYHRIKCTNEIPQIFKSTVVISLLIRGIIFTALITLCYL